MQDFTLDGFLERLKTAAGGEDAATQTYQVMQQVFEHHLETASGVFSALDDDVMLYEDATISIWHYRMPTGVVVPPHDHQVYAIIGVYEGVEANHFYTLKQGELVCDAINQVGQGTAILIQPDSIHSVQTGNNRRSCAIHIYLGAFTKVERSRFDWKTGEAMPLNGLKGIQEEPLAAI